MSDGLLAGRVALVTGAGSGIGRAAGELFAREGSAVVLLDIDGAAASLVAEGIRAEGGAAIGLPCDVTDEEQVREAVAASIREFGALHVAFNNAGIAPAIGGVQHLRGAEWMRAIDVNLRGVWHCMKWELAEMGEGASIVNASSVSGLVGNPGSAVYAAAKHGVVGLTRSVAGEVGARGIRVNALAPGLTRTAMVERLAREEGLDVAAMLASSPLGRMAEPEEIAEAALWLASSRSSFVTGHVLVVDGGETAL